MSRNIVKLAVRGIGPVSGLTLEQHRQVPVVVRTPPTRGTAEHGTPKPSGEDWRDHGACKGKPAILWYGVDGTGSSTYLEGRAICMQCPVRIECLEWALDTAEPFGLWGGLSPRARSKMLTDRNLSPLRGRSARGASLRGKR